jgi:uncharacterized protein YndB with AHSA1/START domain
MTLANFLAAAMGLTAVLAQEGFHVIREEQGVKVYRRDGKSGIEIGAEGLIDAPPEVVRAMLLDYENHPRWLKTLHASRVLYRGPDSLDVYQRLTLPVIDDRDFTLHVTWGGDAQMKWLRFAADTGKGPRPVDGVVRILVNEGGWRLFAVDGGKTWAVYQCRLDLAGSVPRWMMKGRAGKEIAELFENIRDQTQYYRWATAR